MDLIYFHTQIPHTYFVCILCLTSSHVFVQVEGMHWVSHGIKAMFWSYPTLLFTIGSVRIISIYSFFLLSFPIHISLSPGIITALSCQQKLYRLCSRMMFFLKFPILRPVWDPLLIQLCLQFYSNNFFIILLLCQQQWFKLFVLPAHWKFRSEITYTCLRDDL